ncbi:MAG TPA: hypothetical protein VLJ38_22835 [Polyangiaceae bacterium]|nr:hypothetical protein [Polyangiaceae bacterium]
MSRSLLLAFALAAATGCLDERRCHDEMTKAQGAVSGIDSHSLASLHAALPALDTALDACEKAKLGEEHGKLLAAKNQITAQISLLERKAARKAGPTLSAAELERIQKDGDPSCPKGQAYKHAGIDKEIKCTGPQLIDMPLDAVKAYFDARHYKLTLTDAPPRVRAEFGAELFVFTFDEPGAGAKCLELYPAPNIPWREAVGRATGVRLDKLKNPGTIAAKRGELALHVEDTESKQLARIGDCG